MDGLARCVAAPVDVSFGKIQWWVLPLTLFRLGCCEQRILAARSTPLERVIEALPGLPTVEMRRQFLKRAHAQTYADRSISKVPYRDVMAWLRTPDGVAYSLWLCLRDDRFRPPGIKRINKAFQEATPEQMREAGRRLERVSGLDLFAQLDWSLLPESSDRTDRPFPWRMVFNHFAGEPFHWDYERVGRLTLWHVKLYRSSGYSLGGRRNMDRGEQMAFVAKKAEEREYLSKEADKMIAQICGE